MKKYILLFALFFIVGCASSAPTQEILPPHTEYPVTASLIPTYTPIPSATIDYYSTAIIAQQTADEARRVNAIITAEFEQRLQEQMMVTAEHERNVMQIYQWTAQAEPTYIPLTATQQAFVNAQIPVKQTMMADQLTATEVAPTQLVAMIDAENYRKYGDIDNKVRIFAIAAIGIFAICIAIYLLRVPVQSSVMQEQSHDAETVVQMKTTNSGYPRLRRIVIPCSEAQLTELAENLTQGRRTLGINQWEGRNTLWNRDVFLHFRAWLRKAEEHGNVVFVTPTEDGQLAPTDDLFDFLRGWLESRRLPDGYEFKPEPEIQVEESSYDPQIATVTDL